MTTTSTTAALRRQLPRQTQTIAKAWAKIRTRLRRTEGQLRGPERTIGQDTACLDVLTQLAASIAAARSTGLFIPDEHIHACVIDAGPEECEAVLDDLTCAIAHLINALG